MSELPSCIRVLVAEDNALERSTVVDLLAALGHMVVAEPGHGLVAVGVGGPKLGVLTTAGERSWSGHGAPSWRRGCRLGRC